VGKSLKLKLLVKFGRLERKRAVRSAPTPRSALQSGVGEPTESVGFGSKTMKGYVYILKSLDQRFYIGSTNNLERRLAQHHSGHTHSTKRMFGLVPVFKQEYGSLLQARKIESKLKKLKRHDYIEKIIQDGFIKMRG
jgi:putative endonuclease